MNRVVDSPGGVRIGCLFGALVFGVGGLMNLRVVIIAMRAQAIEAALDPAAFDRALHQQWFVVFFLLGASTAFLYFARKLGE